jgi:hypothetical protein
LPGAQTGIVEYGAGVSFPASHLSPGKG